MTDDINMRFVTALRDIDLDKRKKLALQQAWKTYSHTTNPESSFSFIAQMAECTTAEVRQYFIGQRRSINVEQPPSPASTLSPSPSTSSDLTELSENFASAATSDGLSHTDLQQSNSPSPQAINMQERPKRKGKPKRKSFASSDNEEAPDAKRHK
ncbi:29486_t:CDS:2, partial [Racocetra persica]